ncbi:MAG: 50S ribosomal protein L6 [Candidatus Electryonea clarkiae]|nr:50S ribosomal protein L6 [Candidatus Electryonea clarkiae]MDP8288612.1 50S ribosomal protein L6 [Candidatus Electryonea clarkiae]
MSRIGKMPVPIPDKVDVKIDGQKVYVKGPLGGLSHVFEPEVELKLNDGEVIVLSLGETRRHRSMHGLSRTLLANMVEGVSKGFEKILLIAGVGYNAEIKGNGILLRVGYSHPVWMGPPPEIKFEIFPPSKWSDIGTSKQVDNQNVAIRISGINKALVGQVAARMRRIRPPEPYKGKGIRYNNEQVRRKAGKTAGK